MEQAAITPEEDLEGGTPVDAGDVPDEAGPPEAFKEFLEGLDLSGLE
jgi:hypothetical protein